MSCSSQFRDWRDQHVKWSAAVYYNIVNMPKANIPAYHDKYSALVSVDVALSENDIYDSASLYLQAFVETSLPVKSKANPNLFFTTHSGGIKLRKYFNARRQKGHFYVIGGGKIDIIELKLLRGDLGKYDILKNDYVLSAGMGYKIDDRMDVVALYNKGFARVYPSENMGTLFSAHSLSIGFQYSFKYNWWFKKK